MITANERWKNVGTVKEWLRDRLNQFHAPSDCSGMPFFEALLILCAQTIAKNSGRKRAHEILDIASYEIVAGRKEFPDG